MLRWLHLSDFHFRGSDGWDGSPFLRDLLRDVAETSAGRPPDFIVVTGDIAFSGKPEEYALASSYFAEVCGVTGVAPDRCFTVPGNHDVDRKRVSPGAKLIVEMLRRTAKSESVAEIFEGDAASCAQLFAPLAAYSAFAPKACVIAPERFWWATRLAVASFPLPVVLAGLNTAWTAHGEEKDGSPIGERKGNLLIGRHQVEKILAAVAPTSDDLVVTLGHHPLSWAAEWDEREVEGRLMYRADFYLRGHLHQGRELEFTQGAREIAAGSAYAGSQYPNSYNLVTVDLEHGLATAAVRRWFPERGGVWAWDPTIGAGTGMALLRLPERFTAPSRAANAPRRDRRPTPARVWQRGVSPPAALLRAEYGVVPFHGRAAELAFLEEWCDDGADLRVKLCTGAGGMGKSRLFLELCRRMVARGWRCAQLGNASDPVAHLTAEEDARPPVPHLVVIDYAETRPRAVACALLLALGLSRRAKVRVALLARGAGDWWEAIKRDSADVGELLQGPATDRFVLAALAVGPEDRANSFDVAAAAFGRALERESTTARPDLSAAYFERVLLLHMAALAAVEGTSIASTDDQRLLDYVLLRERRFWGELARAREVPQSLDRAIAQAVAVCTLAGGADDEARALSLLKRVPLLRDQSGATRDVVSRLLHDVYPGGQWIEPLQPDLLGEHLAQTELSGDPTKVLAGLLGDQADQDRSA
jgi:hypothetical protein